MDQIQPTTSALPNSQTVPVGCVSSMPLVTSLKSNEQMRFVEPVVPYGTGPQNISLNSSAISMMPRANNLGSQQISVPNSDFIKEMGVIFNDDKFQHMQLPVKRKSPMEHLSGYSLSPGVSMPNNPIGQKEQGPWFNTLASNRNNVQHQMQFTPGVPIPLQLTTQNKKPTQLQTGSLTSGSQKPMTPRSHPNQGKPSPKVQNQSNESVRSKLRESISAALALVTEKEKPASQVTTSASVDVNASEEIQEDSKLTEIAPSVSHVGLSGEKQTEGNQDYFTQMENNLKTELTVVDCEVGGSLQILDGVGQELDMIDIMPDEGAITGNIFAKDDLLQGNGLEWVMDFDAWIEKEGRDPMKQKTGENVVEPVEVKKENSPQDLALQIELELFKLFGGVNKKYKEKGRSLLFNLKDKNNPELREKVMSGEISPARLCSMSAEELASKELSEWRIAKAEEFEQMKILPDSDIDMRRLVKKTHKGEYQVEVEEDDVSVEVSVGSNSLPRIQTEAKETISQSNGVQKETVNGKVNSDEQNRQCTITIPSNERNDLIDGLIQDEMKDAEFLPPIVSLDEFMESLKSEPPSENLPADANKTEASLDNDHAELPSEIKSTKFSPDVPTSAAPVTPDNLYTENPKVDPVTKSPANQPHRGVSHSVVLSKGKTENQPHTDISPSIVFWEGSLQLSISSTIAVSGLFKCGEKASANDWPRTMEIKGRVRLDAFDKFLQDLQKSQSRSIMVMHVILKEDNEKETKALSQVVDSYVADARVGFAEPVRGTEVYLCPPKILDRVEKHLVKDKTEALTLTGDDKGLIGVIVSRKANVSPNSTSHHHKHGLKKHQQTSSRRHNHRQDRNINVNGPNLTPKYPVVPLVSSKATNSAPPIKTETDEDDVPPGFGPRVSQEEDDLPEFSFSDGLSRHVPTQMPVSRPTDQMRQLVQKYGQTASSLASVPGRNKNWKDEEDDIPEWQPPMPLSPAPQLSFQPLNQPMLQHLITQHPRSPFHQPRASAPIQPPMPAAQQSGWSQSSVRLSPQPQGQFYRAQSRGF